MQTVGQVKKQNQPELNKTMETKMLSDANEIPNEELVLSIIGDKELIGNKQCHTCTTTTVKYPKFGNTKIDGKSWLLATIAPYLPEC